jgi:alpha-1,3-rhamnosyltransferase
MNKVLDNKNPLVSILIPCYNHKKYVVECLDSVLADSYFPKEIIIIDDGSIDKSVEIIKDWIVSNSEKVPIKFRHRENKGLTVTLNELIELSNGKYLIPLASDDCLINNTLSQRVNILEENNSKLVLISDARVINSDGLPIFESMISDFHKKDKNKYFTDNDLLDEVLFNFAISGPVLMINRSIYGLIGKYPEKLKAEDLYFYIKSASLKKILFWDRKVSNYRIHTTNTSGTNPALTRTVVLTYLKTINIVPTFHRKYKIIKRILGILFYTILNYKK